MRVWDVVTGMLVERLDGIDGHRDSVYSVAFAPSGRQLVSGSLDKTIKMWELGAIMDGMGQPAVRQGRCMRTFEGHKVCLRVPIFLSDGGVMEVQGQRKKVLM